VDEDPPADSRAAVITWKAVPAVCAVACVVFLIAVAVVPTAADRITCGLAAAFFAVAALANFSKRYELDQGSLVIRRGFATQTIILGELTSVEAVSVKASQGRVYWHVVLEDRQGTRVRLSFLHTAPDAREHFLMALTPFAYAPGVRLTGPVDRAMAGTLW
jgi:hypothetical protein